MPDRPNIVILYADDMGYGDLGVQNKKSKIPTPNLDKLAAEGMRFTNAHSSSGICTPSRYALLTGRYHWRKFHGIVDSWDASVFDKAEMTLPEMLQQNDYRTACVGKWHLGWDWAAIRKAGAESVTVNNKKTWEPDAFDWTRPIPDGPTAHGFDYYYGDDVPNFPPYAWLENDRVVDAPTVMLTVTEKTLEGNWEARPGPARKDWDFYDVMPANTKKAVEWIKEQKQNSPGRVRPFFLYFAFTSPHAPIVPTKEWQGKSGAGAYGDFMMQSDWSAGQVLEALKENGFAENTIVIFTSDNGPEHYAFDRVRNFEHYSMGPLRGVKRDVWDGGHRIPFVVKWPGLVKPGTVSDGLISQIDIMATLADFLKIKLPGEAAEDSFSQLQLLRGKASSARPSMVHNTYDKYAIQKDNWVYIDAKDGEHSKMPDWFRTREKYPADNAFGVLLYNLNKDVSQRENLLSRYPAKAKALREELNKIRRVN
ncbi:arylsulfatase [Persicitalea jodogahamensis]|uniref:Arylsulfatase n=2 Tax=Persicitalea jodogahamensis TaxID=402147 RepID=A0A8J3D0M7_9BACT|nr:arylsulfatase [Persicitalea jodogahamensis]